MVENVEKKNIKVSRINWRNEFLLDEFKIIRENHKIRKQLTTTNTLHQNKVAKWKIHTLLDKTKSMAIHNGVPNYFWIQIVNTTMYLTNRNQVNQTTN
jgi:hypothetical protein